jgi:peptidoglycan/xylan/chitin deacetylase (PgdA/CDA1 family)
MRVPILTYHAVNIAGNDYADNDHVAFAADLRLIDDLRLRIVPVHWIVDQLLGSADRDLSRCVALTCDDGSWFDYHDLDHPSHGFQRSLFHCLIDFRADRGRTAQPDLHLTSFVIASPDARTHIDRECLVGRGWMGDRWWRAAQASGLIAIENHSWDHNHVAVPETAQRDGIRGSFVPIDTWAEADAEIRQAGDWIDARLGNSRTSLFAYPYGESNAYLREEYLPNRMAEHRMRAAFGTDPGPVEAGSSRWNLPRYICGHHWRSPEALEDLLREVAA